MSASDPCLPAVDPLKLVRDGTLQEERYPPALAPENAPVYARDPAQSMLFARAYSAYLRYVDANNMETGTWQPFFSSDVSVALASAAVQDVDRYRTVLLNCTNRLEDRENDGNDVTVRYNLSFIFSAIGTLAEQLDFLKEMLPDDVALKATLRNLIRTKLAAPLSRLISFAQADAAAPGGALIINPLPPADVDHELWVLGITPYSWNAMVDRGLSQDWWGTSTSWASVRSDAGSDERVFGSLADSVFQRANTCAGHSLFASACDQFLKVYARIVIEAASELEITLEDYDHHTPHYALFLSFLQMFEYAREEMNKLTQRHLDFYYRDVLMLAERSATPSSAHVIVELAKNVDSYAIAKGTEFKAPKDASKKLVVFTNDETFVANKAQVALVRSFYRDAIAGEIYMNAAANTEDASYHPFETDHDLATLGFAVSSHYLFLAEGTRQVRLTFDLENYTGPEGVHLQDAFKCRLTTADGWLETRPFVVEIASTTLTIGISLSGDQPAITAFDVKVHDAKYNQALPVLEVRLAPTTGRLDTYQSLEATKVTAVTLCVRANGVRSLTLSSDIGPQDASKPFQPFGPAPVVGSSFIIGYQEAFSKAGLTEAILQLTWRNRPRDLSIGSDMQRLQAGGWSEVVRNEAMDIDLTKAPGSFNSSDNPFVDFGGAYDLKSTSGFVRLRLNESLGHETYTQRLADYVIAKLGGESPAAVTPPYVPELESIRLNYSARQTINLASATESAFNERKARIYHLTSFGVAERHPYLTEKADTSVHLLPQFQHESSATSGSTKVGHQGEFYLGLSGLVPPQTVALLVQVEDGSADPLTEKPASHLHWSYLRGNDWVSLQINAVVDTTAGFMSSGIVTIAVPDDATSDGTIMPTSLHWIRVSVSERANAVCKLHAVFAQAVKLTFNNRDNDPSFLADPLTAGSISKLATPVSAIKKVEQPYESFGGALAESSDSFYTRVSERLRHKDRAITLWDIERLTLEAFQSIHRVKCLNHTRYEPTDTGDVLYHELSAGHITIVTIPKVSPSSSADPLKPYTSLGTLLEINDLIAERQTCFATLHVRNPLFEPLRVSCKVKLLNGFDESYYIGVLKNAITEFLAPWAYDSSQRPSFGGKVYQSTLINFIEEREYVDFLTDFRLFHHIGDEVSTESKLIVEGSKAVSILTSVPSDEHTIEILSVNENEIIQENCGCGT